MHSAKLVHRDMKPANLLLNSDCLMKVADFGLARSLKDEVGGVNENFPNGPVLTDYVATRWHALPDYTPSIQCTICILRKHWQTPVLVLCTQVPRT